MTTNTIIAYAKIAGIEMDNTDKIENMLVELSYIVWLTEQNIEICKRLNNGTPAKQN